MGEQANPAEDRADLQSHEALLRPGDLDGEWQVIQRDVFNEVASTYPDDDACKGRSQLEASILEFRDALLGRAQIQIGRKTASATQGFQIEEWVEIYNSGHRASDLLEKMHSYLSPQGIRCEQAVLNRKGSTEQLTLKEAKHQPPVGGVVLATMRAGNDRFGPYKIDSEYYYWVTGDTGITLVITGVDEQISTELAAAAIEKAKEGLERARKLR